MAPQITLFYYNNDNTFETIDVLEKCPIAKGIWCLYGCKNNSWTCLQVARNNDVISELRSDIASIIEPITLEAPIAILINSDTKQTTSKYILAFVPRFTLESAIITQTRNYISLLLSLQMYPTKKKPKNFLHTKHKLFIGAMEVPTKKNALST